MDDNRLQWSCRSGSGFQPPILWAEGQSQSFVPLGKGGLQGVYYEQGRPPAAKNAAKLSQSFDSLAKGGQM
jgi:hypothetical protein